MRTNSKGTGLSVEIYGISKTQRLGGPIANLQKAKHVRNFQFQNFLISMSADIVTCDNSDSSLAMVDGPSNALSLLTEELKSSFDEYASLDVNSRLQNTTKLDTMIASLFENTVVIGSVSVSDCLSTLKSIEFTNADDGESNPTQVAFQNVIVDTIWMYGTQVRN